jgi:hypothetical protein
LILPSKFPLALLIHTGLICATVLVALYLTGNALALAGLLLIRPIETYPVGNGPLDAESLDEGEDDHQNRTAGFNANYN